MARTRLINLHTSTEAGYVFIGRPSKWGNPYIKGRDGSRDDVCDRFEEDFMQKVMTDSNYREELLQLKGKVLACYCKPQRCHGDIIVRYLNSDEPEAVARRGKLID